MRKSRLSKQKQNRLIEHFMAGTTAARIAAALVGVTSLPRLILFIDSESAYTKLWSMMFHSLVRSKLMNVALVAAELNNSLRMKTRTEPAPPTTESQEILSI